MPLRKIKNPRSFEKCRTCNHYFISHQTSLDGAIYCQWMYSSYQPHHCDCKDFAPKDNLEFLEYEYGKLDSNSSN